MYLYIALLVYLLLLLYSGAAQQINGDLSLSDNQDNEDADLRPQSALSDDLERPASNEIPELQDLFPKLSVHEADRPQSADLILESSSSGHHSIPESFRPKSAEPDTDLEKIDLQFRSQTELNESTRVAKEPDDDQSESLGTTSEKGDLSKDEFLLVEYQEEPVAISPAFMDNANTARSGRAKSLPPPTIDHTPSTPVANGTGPDWQQAKNEAEVNMCLWLPSVNIRTIVNRRTAHIK